ncbi:MAG TPA: hypothetical protein VIM69_10485 [Opitutaceae bacterium]
MNPVCIVSIDTLANAFDQIGLKVAPLVTIEFANEADLNRWLTQLHTELIHYTKNAIVVKPSANVVDKYNDVLCNFKLRSQ